MAGLGMLIGYGRVGYVDWVWRGWVCYVGHGSAMPQWSARPTKEVERVVNALLLKCCCNFFK